MSTKHYSMPIGGRLYFDDSPMGTVLKWMKSRYAITQTALTSGTADSYTKNHLKDSANSFSNVNVGDIVYNTTDKIFAVVLNVAANDLTLDYEAFPDGDEEYSIYAEPILPSGWVEANGQTINDPDSDFTKAPLINDDNSTLYDIGLSQDEYVNELIIAIVKIKATPAQMDIEGYATEEYVNASLAANTLNLFLTDTSSAEVGGYYEMLFSETGVSGSTLTQNSVSDGETLLWSYVSPQFAIADQVSAGLYIVSVWENYINVILGVLKPN